MVSEKAHLIVLIPQNSDLHFGIRIGYEGLYPIIAKETAMSEQEYEDLWHYSERFTRDKLQRSELVTMAWKEGERLGNRSTPGLMKSFMHFRDKGLYNRSAFPAKEMGKSTRDAWNRRERV